MGDLVGSLIHTGSQSCPRVQTAVPWGLSVHCKLGLSATGRGTDFPAPAKDLHFHFTLGPTLTLPDLISHRWLWI